MRAIPLLLLIGAVVCVIDIEIPPLPDGETDLTADLEDIVSVKLAEAFHRLTLQADGIPLILLHILRISRRSDVGDLHIIAKVGPKPQICTLILREVAENDNQRLDITCGEREWHVIRVKETPTQN